MQLEVGQGTHTGMVRSGNEDSFFADPPAGLFVVADGMGGHAAGEIASDMAVRIVSDELRVIRDITSDDVSVKVSDALKRANQEIYERTLTEVDKQGMGTTASMLIVGQDRYLIGQVGDSRIYLLRDGEAHAADEGSFVRAGAGGRRPADAGAGALPSLQQRDHALRGRGRDGGSPTPTPASSSAATRVPARERRAHRDGGRPPPAAPAARRARPGRIVDALIAEANGRGGLDNITAIVVRILATDADLAKEKSGVAAAS